jgi:hypothetical protein
MERSIAKAPRDDDTRRARGKTETPYIGVLPIDTRNGGQRGYDALETKGGPDAVSRYESGT